MGEIKFEYDEIQECWKYLNGMNKWRLGQIEFKKVEIQRQTKDQNVSNEQ
jgi:hypothetical protein